MYNYHEITSELIKHAKIPKEDVFNYEYSPLRTIYEQYFQFCQTNLSERSTDYKIQPAKFFYIEKNGINALAGYQNNYYIIGVFKGTISSLYNLFYERNDLFDGESELYNYSKLNKTLKVPIGYLMFQFATLFTFYHEQAHLIQKSDLLNLWLKEIYLEKDDKQFSQEKHVFEFDSDLHGAHLCCFHLIDYWDKQENKFQTQENLQMLLSLGAASIFSYFMLMQTTQLNIYYKESSHPHPIVRILYIIDCFIEVAKINLPKDIILDLNLTLTESFKISNRYFITVLKSNIVDNFVSTFESEKDNIENYIAELIKLSKVNLSLVRHKKSFQTKTSATSL